jgi:hypothetical protein
MWPFFTGLWDSLCPGERHASFVLSMGKVHLLFVYTLL